jgi:hypothetical protein
MVDLWPSDIVQNDVKPPVAILKEQASLLGNKTKNLVTAEVHLDDPDDYGYSIVNFNYRFLIIAPALNNYQFKLFSVAYDVDLYPVQFQLDQSVAAELDVDEQISVGNEEEFQNLLKRIFGTQRTRRVISAISNQSTIVRPGYAEHDDYVPF